jgi:hypothetical protein
MIWKLVFLLFFESTSSNLVYLKTGIHEFSRNLEAILKFKSQMGDKQVLHWGPTHINCHDIKFGIPGNLASRGDLCTPILKHELLFHRLIMHVFEFSIVSVFI